MNASNICRRCLSDRVVLARRTDATCSRWIQIHKQAAGSAKFDPMISLLAEIQTIVSDIDNAKYGS